ncbi:hypothetical protein [Streptomyces kebangsaanensis]|uniref:hypothetical protein n=1 Tax=Streptomyces kebangsaanensis TaxID=864058 RepID=UPI0009392014|nr:hypothetical protein [Streptomyces kebangsaanensis]
MTIKGIIGAAGIACAAVTAGVIWLWPHPDAPKPPTSEEIKASAQARLDASLDEGRTYRQVLLDDDMEPSDELCQAIWDRKPRANQQELLYSMWMHGCADEPNQ